jgi:hypothetical protein
MKKLLTILFLFSLNYCYASAGSANDENFFILCIIAILLFVIAILYSIDFIKRIIKDRKKNIANDSETNVSES